MQIVIDNRSGDPIYDQITRQIKAQIIGGTLLPDEALPSIRNLAKDLRISVVTTKRAYDELEREGFLYTVAGKGCFVAAKNTEFLREEALRQVETALTNALDTARRAGISGVEVASILNILLEESV